MKSYLDFGFQTVDADRSRGRGSGRLCGRLDCGDVARPVPAAAPRGGAHRDAGRHAGDADGVAALERDPCGFQRPDEERDAGIRVDGLRARRLPGGEAGEDEHVDQRRAGGRVFDDTAQIHDSDAISDMFNDAQIMTYEQISQAEFFAQVHE